MQKITQSAAGSRRLARGKILRSSILATVTDELPKVIIPDLFYLDCPVSPVIAHAVRISRITLFASPIAQPEPFIIALVPLTHARNVRVRVEADMGQVGWGEASPFSTIHGETMEGVLAVGELLVRHLLGLDPRDVEAITLVMVRCVAGNACAKSAFDMACYDLSARAAQLPLYAFLGGNRPRAMHTDYTISLGPLAEMAEKARWIVVREFPSIKIKLGGPPNERFSVDPDVARVRAIFRAAGPLVPLRLDANQGWTVDRALKILTELAGLPTQDCEAPIPRREFLLLPKIRAASPIPIMADESCWDELDLQHLLALGAVDKVNLKLSKAGGLFRARILLRLAEEHHIPVQMGGSLESRLGFAAADHLASASDAVKYYDFNTPLM